MQLLHHTSLLGGFNTLQDSLLAMLMLSPHNASTPHFLGRKNAQKQQTRQFPILEVLTTERLNLHAI